MVARRWAARLASVRVRAEGSRRPGHSRWRGDITYIGTWEGWLYLATVIEIASRRVVGYAMVEHLATELICDARHA